MVRLLHYAGRTSAPLCICTPRHNGFRAHVGVLLAIIMTISHLHQRRECGLAAEFGCDGADDRSKHSKQSSMNSLHCSDLRRIKLESMKQMGGKVPNTYLIDGETLRGHAHRRQNVATEEPACGQRCNVRTEYG